MTAPDPPTRPWRRLAAACDLEALGASIARWLGPGDAVCLYGRLGAGKSTLARGLIRALAGREEDVPSPTFTLVQLYETPVLSVAHFDLYRLSDPAEALELGLEEAMDVGAAVIEWPERLGAALPAQRLDVELRFPQDGATAGREVRVTGRGSWIERAQELGREYDF